MKLKKILFSVISMLTMSNTIDAKTTITTSQIIPSVLSPECTEYKVVGTCYWLLCTYGGCKVRISTKVKHYIPDVVISSYANTYENPWTEASSITQTSSVISGSSAQSGGDTNNRQANNHTKVRFKNVDAFGHPGGAAFSAMLSGMGYYCNNGVTPLFPYFLSTVDFFAWRGAPLEQFYPESLVPGVREVGNQASGNMWGNIYPRAGAIIQTDDYKAAAVAAQRGADILTRNGQMHIYTNYTKKKKDGFWPPDPIHENDRNNHKWQSLAPKMSMTCGIFPGLTGMTSEDGAYAWALWRPYKCCKRKGQKFLYSIDWSN